MASRIVTIPRRRWRIHDIGWAAAAALIATLAFLPVASTVMGSAPPEHKVAICHATPPDTAANGWHVIVVDVASVGYQHAGHQDQHDADIIPPYAYGTFSFPGKNWTSDGQAIWANDCVAVTPTPTPEPTPTQTPEPTPTPTPTPEPTGNVLPTEDTNPSPTGHVLPIEGTPVPTLPPTDAATAVRGDVPAGTLAIVVAALAASIVGLVAVDRSIRRAG